MAQRMLLDRHDGVDIIEEQHTDGNKSYTIELFDPNDEDATTYEILCTSKEQAEQLFYHTGISRK